MARLRIRIELSRGGVGVPLGKLAGVVGETHKFLRMLAEDVHIDDDRRDGRGEWLGFDFANESLNFTAEYSGAVKAEQVRAFYAAFDGTTALRRATIAQFAGITASIGEDDLVGFGLYGADDAVEPAEWRCLSRRDAARISEEISVLLKATGEQESHLPAVTDAGSSLFRRSREEEASLEDRLTRVERRVEQHAAQIHDLRAQSSAAEESFRNLLSAVETFCEQATQQIERATPGATVAGALPPAATEEKDRRWILIGAGAVFGILLLVVLLRSWPARPAPVEVPKAAAAAAPIAPVVEAPVRKTMRIEVEASEPAWVSMTDADGNALLMGLIHPGESRSFEVDRAAKLRTGNAGGLIVKLDGKLLGPLGPAGQIREVAFSEGTFKVTTPGR